MIPFGDKTVTLYNRYQHKVDGKTVTEWVRRVLTGCFWKNERVMTFAENIKLATFKTVCKIPESALYVDPLVWAAEDTDRDECFTLALGDVIVLGEVTDEVGESLSITALLAKYKPSGAMTAEIVANNTGTMRALGHYKATGA